MKDILHLLLLEKNVTFEYYLVNLSPCEKNKIKEEKKRTKKPFQSMNNDKSSADTCGATRGVTIMNMILS